MAGAALLTLGLGCGLDDADDLGPPRPIEDWPLLACDDLVEGYCAFPFPSNVYTAKDDATPTGRRVALSPDTMPVNYYGNATLPDPWNGLDGFSTGVAPMAHFSGLTLDSLRASGAATPDSIGSSIEPGSPTILLDTETGELVPHFVDLDMTARRDEQRALMIRPAVRLADARRYIVAIRGLEDESGTLIEPSETFLALREGTETSEASVEDRRDLYQNIFATLKEAGVDYENLQLAWDYTTASKENNTGWMVHMRDEALAMVGDAGPSYTIDSVDEPPFAEGELDDAHIAYRIFGTMTVPLYLDQPGPGAKLIFGADGLPEPNPEMPTAEFEFEVLIPHSATMTPGALIQYGHGLLGEKEQIESGHFLSFIDQYNYVLFGVDFVGFAADDELPIGAIIDSGRFDEFSNVIDRQLQGMLNSLLAMRMMKGGFAQDPTFGAYIDPSEAYYHGISQGGIYGGTYMALTTDVQRGALGVMGMPYSLLLTRSVDFDIFFDLIRGSWRDDDRDSMYLLALAQMLWDRIEPNGYVPYIRENMLPGTPGHEVFMRDALGDHQVTTLGAHVMARALGVPLVDQGIRDVWGLETVPPPVQGSALVEYDFGLPPDPLDNTPQRECEDPHGKLRKLEPARQQLDLFLRQGTIDVFCDGACVFADMSGCG
jgi:hypothetical protein